MGAGRSFIQGCCSSCSTQGLNFASCMGDHLGHAHESGECVSNTKDVRQVPVMIRQAAHPHSLKTATRRCV